MSNLFAESKILKFEDFLHYRNINIVKNSIEKSVPASINDFFIQRKEIHQHSVRSALNNLTDIPQTRASFYGTHSMRSKSAIAWNTMQYELGFNFKDYNFKILKERFFNRFLQPIKSKTNIFILSLITHHIILKLLITFPGC